MTCYKMLQNTSVKLLLRVIYERDKSTFKHSKRLKALIERMTTLDELNDYNKSHLLLLALLHDIGKVGIPDSVLKKTSTLTTDEFSVIKSHCDIGYRIVKSVPGLEYLAELIYKHHERWDGNGYPLGTKGDQIPIECRILSIADAYDAMTSERPYNKTISHSEAIEEIKRCSGTQFDPYWVIRFVNSV